MAMKHTTVDFQQQQNKIAFIFTGPGGGVCILPKIPVAFRIQIKL